jgi:mRNA interferase MazF
VVSRGDVCWVDVAEEGTRPALVLTRVEAIPVMRKVTVAFLTRTIRDIPSEVRLGPDDGMPDECVVNLDNLRQIPRSLLGEPITSLAGKRMHEVCRALAVATGCDWRGPRA